MLDVSDIKLIHKVAELGSINRAADELFMSQPTLSKRISRLEQTLKVKLFFRHSGGMKPTDVANYLINNGQLVQAKLDSMCRHVERLASLQGGTLNVGVGPIIEQLYFPQVLLDFVEATKDVKMKLKTANAAELLQMVVEGHMDLAIGPIAADELPNDLVISPLINAPIIFVGRPGHPLLDESQLTWKKLSSYPKISPRKGQSTQIPSKHQNLKDSIQIVCDNFPTSISLVKVSDFLTAGPRLLFQQALDSGTLVEIPFNAGIHWQSSWIARAEAVHTPAVAKFIEILTAHPMSAPPSS